MAAGHAHRAGDTAIRPPRAEKSSKHPTWPPSNLSSTLSQCFYAHFTASVSLSIFLITCHRLSLSSPSLLFISLSLSHSLFLSLIASISVSLLLCLSLPHHLLLSFTPCHHLSSCPLSLPFYYLFLSLTGCWGWTGALRFH